MNRQWKNECIGRTVGGKMKALVEPSVQLCSWVKTTTGWSDSLEI
jgi:hypothetical protein